MQLNSCTVKNGVLVVLVITVTDGCLKVGFPCRVKSGQLRSFFNKRHVSFFFLLIHALCLHQKNIHKMIPMVHKK